MDTFADGDWWRRVSERLAYVFLCNATFDEAKGDFVLETLFPVALDNVKWDTSCRLQPWIPSMALRTASRFRDSVRRSIVLTRKSIDSVSFMVKDWFDHLRSFEYEYEYRFTEYEYEESRAEAGTLHKESSIWQSNKSDLHRRQKTNSFA